MPNGNSSIFTEIRKSLDELSDGLEKAGNDLQNSLDDIGEYRNEGLEEFPEAVKTLKNTTVGTGVGVGTKVINDEIAAPIIGGGLAFDELQQQEILRQKQAGTYDPNSPPPLPNIEEYRQLKQERTQDILEIQESINEIEELQRKKQEELEDFEKRSTPDVEQDNDTISGSPFPTPDPDADNPPIGTSNFVGSNTNSNSFAAFSQGRTRQSGSLFDRLLNRFGSNTRTPGVVPNTGANPNRFRNMPTNTEEFLAFTGNLNNYLNGISVRSGFVQSQQRLNEASAIQDAAQAAVFKMLEGDGSIKDQFISSIGQTVIQELSNPGSRLSESLGGQAGLSLEGGFGAGLLPGEHQGMNYSRSQQAEFIINFLKKWGR